MDEPLIQNLPDTAPNKEVINWIIKNPVTVRIVA
jgi:hypothetical protein